MSNFVILRELAHFIIEEKIDAHHGDIIVLYRKYIKSSNKM